MSHWRPYPGTAAGGFWKRLLRNKRTLAGVVLLSLPVGLAVFGPWIAPKLPQPTWFIGPPSDANSPPAWSYRNLFGIDPYGSPVIAEVILGARATLEIGLGGAAMATLLGLLVGGLCGHLGGLADWAGMRIVDMFLALPLVPLVLLVLAVRSGEAAGVTLFVLAFGVLGWPAIARTVRGRWLLAREQGFVQAARVVGSSTAGTFLRHLLPGLLGPAIGLLTVAVTTFISIEATMDFLGIGLRSPDSSWGMALASTQQSALSNNWWSIAFPGLALMFTILAIRLLGDGLIDALEAGPGYAA